MLACPACRNPVLQHTEDGHFCAVCGIAYPTIDGIPSFLMPDTPIRGAEQDRAEFWNAGWEKRNRDYLKLNRDEILARREVFLTAMRGQAYPSVTDIGPFNVANTTFLNIGCGGGDEGLLFAGYGANYVGVDFSFNAARYTQELISRAGFSGHTYHAEAEHLPFKDDSFDFIYSNGVLHHTPNTLEALTEARRVLSPNGTALIGLYATRSITFYWYRLHAILHGNVTGKSIEKWVDANTEGEWKTEGRENAWTRTYTSREYADLLKQAGFRKLHIRHTPMQLKHIPLLGRMAEILFPRSIAEKNVGRVGMILMATCSK